MLISRQKSLKALWLTDPKSVSFSINQKTYTIFSRTTIILRTTKTPHYQQGNGAVNEWGLGRLLISPASLDIRGTRCTLNLAKTQTGYSLLIYILYSTV